MNPRTLAAVWAGKVAGAASRASRRGGGTAVAGLVAERIDPRIVVRLLSQAGAGALAVTGTNGKTTTSLMLNRIAVEAGLRPLHNRSGSNLMRGLAAMLVADASLSVAIPDAARRLAILEVDEATLPVLAGEAPLQAIVFTNLFRDQLDRYGEVDAVAKAWERALAGLSGQMEKMRQRHAPTLVLNADDPAIAHLGREYAGPTLYYGVDDLDAGGDTSEHASDFRTCLDCGGELAYDVTFYGHLGHWRCPSCGSARPAPSVRLKRVTLGDDRTALGITLPDAALSLALPMAGLYNAYNALAATAAAVALALPHDAIVRALEGFSAAFGRQERFDIDGREVRVLLGKNPTGLNQVLRAVAARPGEKRILFLLNDHIADGRDVSWIWDADYEIARRGAVWAHSGGTRAEDLAIRLKYAGYGDAVPAARETSVALQHAIDATPHGSTLYVVPTYSAMIEVRELIARRAGAPRYWDGDGE